MVPKRGFNRLTLDLSLHINHCTDDKGGESCDANAPYGITTEDSHHASGFDFLHVSSLHDAAKL